MSQFSTMTTRERKMQAAAICREFQAQEDIEMDLGKKVSVPKDIMLEELSLASNRGSRLFKMRQRRSEKYTFETIQNQNNKLLNNAAFCENGNTTDSHSSQNNGGVKQPLKMTSDTAAVVPDPTSIAPGFDRVGKQFSPCLESAGLMQNMRYGGPLKDIPPERFNNTAVPKSYHSPWEQAIINDPALADTLTSRMPELEPRHDLPGYKSFNRVATPFGGFSKAPRPAPLKTLQVEILPELPELQGDASVIRPSFNRSALGWVSTGGAAPLRDVSPENALIPESEDL